MTSKARGVPKHTMSLLSLNHPGSLTMPLEFGRELSQVGS